MKKTLLALVALTACASDWTPDPRCDARRCSMIGQCQYVSADDGCRPLSDADCQQSEFCRTHGACYLRAGGGICTSTKPKGK